jgi:DeoR/GlpR family transcriptional regulator of sugar metabolism
MILRYLEYNSRPSIEKLAQKMQTSTITIRRDLLWLQDNKYIDRSGLSTLVLNNNRSLENIFSSTQTIEKRAIAKLAASLVEDGDTIFLNSSSTALLMLDYLEAVQVTVITNNLKVLFAEPSEKSFIILTGGEVRMPKESLVGDFAYDNISMVTAAKCFMGCSGINRETGFTTAVLQEVQINRRMIERTIGKKYILADYTKVGRTHSFLTCPLSDIDAVITDTQTSQKEIDDLIEGGVEVIIAEQI